MFPKTQDHTIDRLLRAQGSGPGNGPLLCREFDADLANAYVERHLTAGETTRYEQHLATCSPCRRSIIALRRMAEPAAARADVVIGRPPAESPLRRWLGALTTPQWAMAAAAAIVLAITLPLALSTRHKPTAVTVDMAQANATPPAPATADGQMAGYVAADSNTPNTATSATHENPSAPASTTVSDKPATVNQEKREAVAAPEPAHADESTAPAPAKSTEPPPADQAAAKKAENQTPPGSAAPAAQPPATEPSLAKIDPEKAKQLPKETDATATTLKPSQIDGVDRKTDDAIRSSEIAPPPTRGRADADRQRRREGMATGGPSVASSAFRDSGGEPARAARGASRTVGKRLFLLRDNVWTDKDYNPDKDMPVVTIIRDSDNYRDLLAKEEKLKPFFTDFPAEARVIVVFKGTVYKLVPQNANH